MKFPLKDKTFRDQLLLYNSVKGQGESDNLENLRHKMESATLLTQREMGRLPYDC